MELQQDNDVLDTWFSSWLWPISLFDGFNSREELDYYYPTNVLVTGWDIIFLWVARMVMAGYEWENKRPFEDVYFTGMVRDKQRRKMSKSLGNSPDALGLIAQYGADGVRYGIMSSSPAGGDLLFDEKLCENGRNFCNKIWNALQLLNYITVDEALETPEKNRIAVEWMESNINKVIAEIEEDFKVYRLSEAIQKLHHLIWNDYCSWFLEIIKPDYGQSIDTWSIDQSKELLAKLMNMLHPFMPFITEEVWHHLKGADAEDLCVAAYPKGSAHDDKIIADFEDAKELITKIREVRSKAEMKKSEGIGIFYSADQETFIAGDDNPVCSIVAQLTNATIEELKGEVEEGLIGFLSGTEKYYAKIEKELDIEAEIENLTDELKRLEGFLKGISGKLSNKGFVANAPDAVVEKERQKQADTVTRIGIIKENLEAFKS